MTQDECVQLDHVLQMYHLGNHRDHRPSSIRDPQVESATSITVHQTPGEAAADEGGSGGRRRMAAAAASRGCGARQRLQQRQRRTAAAAEVFRWRIRWTTYATPHATL